MSVQQRVRYHEFMRPRYSNPSFVSSNVGATMGILYYQQPIGSSANRNITENAAHNPGANYSYIKAGNYETKPSPKQQPVQLQINQQLNKRSNSQSNLSNYGTKSLGKLQKLNDHDQNNTLRNGLKLTSKLIDQRDIYQKQKKNYNIISIQPLEYGNETIKKYSKYRLQNKDPNYYKNIKLQEQYRRGYNHEGNRDTRNTQQYPRFTSNPEINNINMSNSVVQNGGSYEPVNQQFRPKMLNNIDELGGVL